MKLFFKKTLLFTLSTFFSTAIFAATEGLENKEITRINKLLKTAYPEQKVMLNDENFALKQLKLVADYQITNLKRQEQRLKNRTWEVAPFYRGLASAYRLTKDQKYLDLMEKIAGDNKYYLGNSKGFADDHAVVQLYVELALLTGKKHYIEQAKKDFKEQIKVMHKYPFRFKYHRHRWSWADALFMAPPAWAGISTISGDNSYMDFMVEEFKTNTNALYSPNYKLYFRDERFLSRRSEAGKPIFWSRGNGWVYAGIASVLKWMPKDHASRSYFEKIFIEMSRSLILLQNRKNGLWSMSLLDKEEHSLYETSGSAFFCYGLFWGINNGVLDANRYLPYAVKSWNGLNDKVTSKGRVTYVQPIGAAPGKFNANDTEIYGVGGYLMAAEEYINLIHNTKSLQKITGSCYGRFVPERIDDYSWENDYVAFRAYGPQAATTGVGNGFDCWLKRVPYPVVDNFYKQDKAGKSYHKDYGEGYDPYKVGTSFGAGSLGLRDKDPKSKKVYYGNVFYDHKTIIQSGFVTKFKLFYNWNYQGRKLKEEKTITLHSGERLFKVESSFTNAETNEIVPNLPVVIGITLHDKRWTDRYVNKKSGIFLGSENYNGDFGVGVKIAPEKVEGYRDILAPKIEHTGHMFINSSTDKNGKISYYTGYGWEKFEGFTANDFGAYLDMFQVD